MWAAGVTYATSRSARNEESGGHDFYDRVYDAERPEVFFKAAPGRVRGPGAQIGVRADSGWDVPEPELALVIGADAEILGYTIGNDVSSRCIEGENPLYLPQAKTYTGSCALGPCIVPAAEAPDPDEMEIRLTISRGGDTVFEGETQTALLKRKPPELVRWLYKAYDFPVGAVPAHRHGDRAREGVHAARRRRGQDRDHRAGRARQHGGGGRRVRAIVWQGPSEMTIEERPEPRDPGPGDVILEPQAVGICGSRDRGLSRPHGQSHAAADHGPRVRRRGRGGGRGGEASSRAPASRSTRSPAAASAGCAAPATPTCARTAS